jgi:hypothetical protein
LGKKRLKQRLGWCREGYKTPRYGWKTKVLSVLNKIAQNALTTNDFLLDFAVAVQHLGTDAFDKVVGDGLALDAFAEDVADGDFQIVVFYAGQAVAYVLLEVGKLLFGGFAVQYLLDGFHTLMTVFALLVVFHTFLLLDEYGQLLGR